jgi:hypothetical protein
VIIPDAEAAEAIEFDLGHLETEVGGVSLLNWINGMVNDTEDWQNLVDDGLE